MSEIPCMGPEGIEYIRPKSGFNLALNTKDQIRWAHIFQNLKEKGLSAEKAEIQAFLQVYAIKDPHLKY
jgi:DNA-binding transcriptional MocR family regulator